MLRSLGARASCQKPRPACPSPQHQPLGDNDLLATRAYPGRCAFCLRQHRGQVRCRSRCHPSQTIRHERQKTYSASNTTACGKHVVDTSVITQPIATRERIVLQAAGVRDVQTSCAATGSKFTWTNQFGVFMCTAWQHVQNVFSPHDGQRKCLRVAVDGGEKDPSPGLTSCAQALPRTPGLAHAPAFPCMSQHRNWPAALLPRLQH
jgi:hypothetical protein